MSMHAFVTPLDFYSVSNHHEMFVGNIFIFGLVVGETLLD